MATTEALPKLSNLIPSWANPFSYIYNDMQGIVGGLQDKIESVIIHAPPQPHLSLLDAYQHALMNWAAYIAYIVFIYAVTVFMLVYRKGRRILRSLVVMLSFGLVGPSWPWIVTQMVDAGTRLSKIADFYHPASTAASHQSILSGIANQTGGFFAGAITLLFGSGLALFMLVYGPGIQLFQLWGPVAYSFSALGKRGLQITNLLLSFGLVVTMLGRPVAIFWIEMGELWRDTFPLGKNPLGSIGYTVMAYAFATIAQLILLAACYVGVTRVEGYIKAQSAGRVAAVINKTVKAELIQSRAAAARKALPIVVMNYDLPPGKQPNRVVNHKNGRRATELAGNALSTAHPAAGQAVKAGGRVVFHPKK